MKMDMKNGIVYFISDLKNYMEEKGTVCNDDIENICETAFEIWTKMKSSDRWKYEEIAREKSEKNEGILYNISSYTDSQFNTNHIGLEMPFQASLSRLLHSKTNVPVCEIEKTVHPLQSLSLATYIFHVIHVNYYYWQGNVLIPCELAIAEFNIMDGVRKVYHTLINPGQLPLGVAFDAELHSANSHQIPLPPNKLICESNYKRIKQYIKNFMMTLKDFMPPLYTYSEKNVHVVKTFLCSLKDTDDCFEPQDEFRVYSLSNLFYELKNACARQKNLKGFPFVPFAEKELEKDIFSFTRGISCKFHEQTEAIDHCSLSQVLRWSYTIVESCCIDLGIELLPKQHLPEQAYFSYVQKIKNREQINDCTNYAKQNNIDNLQLSKRSYKGKNLSLCNNFSVAKSKIPKYEHMLHLPHVVNDKKAPSRIKPTYKIQNSRASTSLSRPNATESLNDLIENKEFCNRPTPKKLFLNESSTLGSSINPNKIETKLTPHRLPKSKPEALMLLKHHLTNI